MEHKTENMKQEFESKEELLQLIEGKFILVWVMNLSYVRVARKELMKAMKDRKYIIGEVYTSDYTTAIVFK